MKNILIATFREYFSQEGVIFRYALSYCFLLALFPSLIIVVIMFHNGLIAMDNILPLIYQFVPKDFIEPFIRYILNKNHNTTLSTLISFLASYYMSSNSFYSFMLISASREGFKTYSILIRLKSIVVFSVFICIGILLGWISQYGILDYTFLTLCGVFIILYCFYRCLTFQKRDYWYGVWGALFSSMAIILIGTIFYSWISDFTSYDSIYGPLASFVIMLLGIYIIASVIYLGYCINHACDPQVKAVYKHMWLYHKVAELKKGSK